jgi:membrane-associated phospholipid phosphatase
VGSTTNPRGKGTSIHAEAKPGKVSAARCVTVRLRPFPIIIFVIGFILLTVSAFFVHAHPRPYPIDLQVTDAVQALPLPPFAVSFVDFFSALNDPLPSIIALGAWLVGLIIIGLIARLRSKSPTRWFESGIGIIATVGIASGINYIYNLLVNRPRPGSFGEHIRILLHRPEKSFPSGHTEHDIAYYGFLLFLSFTPPVSTWKYRWALIPFQIYCVVDILSIGFSRIYEGEHWLTDVLAGYLSGAIWLLMCIFLYRWITEWIALLLGDRRQAAATTAS